MATTSIPHRWKYHVFVSFRGEDIRKNFMDHMFNDFKQKGIHAFRDDRELPKGEEISPQLYKAIEESRFLIVIFSKNYASSTWCLRELVKILECKQIEDPKHEVRIIFYDAKPDFVRKQKRSYAKAYAKHDVSNRTEVDKWKEALSMAANLSGWDLQDMTNGFESKFIDSISREIRKKIFDGPLHVGENLVGIDIHFDKLDLSRFVGSDKVNMIGICGISGIGKTTLTKAIYNLMYVHFEGSCFCEDVKEITKRQGLIQVQLHMIGKIMKREDLKIPSVGEGIMVIKKIMSSRPTLLVLDDVDDHEQLEALAGSPTWFCPGSLIIFTGKDKQLLRSHRVDEIHEMGNLDKCEALELFSLYAFGKRHPTEDFEEFAFQIVKYLDGHPLDLKVFGRLLYAKSVYVWKSQLDRLQTYPNLDLVQKLRLTFDSLASDQKRMFLDIACAFIGENKDFAASVLDGIHCSANAIIEVLADKFLITVSKDCLQMRELIQSMAREVVLEEFIMTGKQRRLCISSASSGEKVAMTEATEVLVLLLRKSSQKVHMDANSFALMKNLRILKIYAEEEFDQKVEFKGYNVKYSGSLNFLSNELSLFYWHGCPFKYLPSDFYPENIVAIDLSYSNIKTFWTTPKCFRRLRVMKLSYCCNLTTTPNFSEISNLEELTLEGCVNLVSVHPSIGMLKRLVVLNLRDCERLRNFPCNVEMDALQVLNLMGCPKVDQLPDAFGRIKSLTELHVDKTAITELPSFVSSLVNLKIRLGNILFATNNFDEKNLRGRGGIFNSYKGQLLWSGEFIDIVAQRLNKDLEDREQMFWNVISMLSTLKHKNLVSLVGFCDENDEKIIIYKSDVRGSLDYHLSDSMRLTWVRRLEISVGLANALSYIHYDELRDFSVIHRRIESGTVLLNDNWEPKLSGFQDSFKIKASQRHHSFYTDRLAYVKGYGDPTYIETKSVNHKSDIYSFGVVLFELLCGYKNDHLAPLAVTLYREKKLINIIDRELLKQMDLHSFNMFADIAYECLDNERSLRPNIDDIVPRLEKALELQLKPENYDNNSIVEGSSSSSIQKKFQHLKIELQAIKSATNEFDDSHCIGKGGFGKVYKAELIHSKGQSVVALKRLNRRFGQGDIEFWKEVIMLSSYRHNNIVSLLGFCDDCGEKILIYEYVSRESLDLYLNNKDLTWVQRLEICIGAARGLAYLHDPGQTQQRVLHRDIKSSNILLDENWNARIADFGLSKFGPANQQYTFLVSHAVGTPGYCDPLYAETGLLTKESDVYSFGVVLFEMLCGRLCFGSEPLIGLVRKCYKQKTIDDIIFGNIKDEINPHSLKAFTTIAYQCLNIEQERPSMTMVVKELESALKLQVSNVPPPPSLSPAESSASPNESSLILRR